MAIKIPVRADYTGADVTGLAEYQTNEVIPVTHGGTGIATVSANAILLGSSVNSLTQMVIPDGYILMGAADDTVVSTNIINCGRVA
jgi:hypothetical protein